MRKSKLNEKQRHTALDKKVLTQSVLNRFSRLNHHLCSFAFSFWHGRTAVWIFFSNMKNPYFSYKIGIFVKICTQIVQKCIYALINRYIWQHCTLQSAWSRSLIISKWWTLVSIGINIECEHTVQQNVNNKQNK